MHFSLAYDKLLPMVRKTNRFGNLVNLDHGGSEGQIAILGSAFLTHFCDSCAAAQVPIDKH